MIVFHEGLPGAGKSYEACLMHIIPALKQGRKVVTNIEGINNEKFSQVTNIPLNIVNMLLISIDSPDCEDDHSRYELQKKKLLDLDAHDSLILIDEAQDIWPSGRQKLDVYWQKFFASHRHYGNDIILMGQTFKAIHTFIRGRCHRKIVFTKLTALGKNDSYRWEAYEASVPEKFEKITSGLRNYEKKFFGLYSSHVQKTTIKNVYEDARTNILKTKLFAVVIPVFLILSYFAFSYITDFFDPEKSSLVANADEASQESRRSNNVTRVDHPIIVNETVINSSDLQGTDNDFKPSTLLQEKLDLFYSYSDKYKLRLAGVIKSADKLLAIVQVLDDDNLIIDSFRLDELLDLGWTYEYKDSGLYLKKAYAVVHVRSLPVSSYATAYVPAPRNHSAGSIASAGTYQRPASYLIPYEPPPRIQPRTRQ